MQVHKTIHVVYIAVYMRAGVWCDPKMVACNWFYPLTRHTRAKVKLWMSGTVGTCQRLTQSLDIKLMMIPYMVSLKLGIKCELSVHSARSERRQVTAIFSQVLTRVPPTYNFMLHLLLIMIRHKLVHCYSIEKRISKG